jgi:hypothetical protein
MRTGLTTNLPVFLRGTEMSEIKDGGPAFPIWELNGQGNPEMTGFGMTLRDYFAAKAMEGLLAQSCGTAMGSDPIHGAQYAYAMADAMLKARRL